MDLQIKNSTHLGLPRVAPRGADLPAAAPRAVARGDVVGARQPLHLGQVGREGVLVLLQEVEEPPVPGAVHVQHGGGVQHGAKDGGGDVIVAVAAHRGDPGWQVKDLRIAQKLPQNKFAQV